ncbi:ABC transporter permease [Litorilinea aerophila]|uniref:ABC transporter permease n=1 Tax=Litorilinea aerophila TaxID=1204385 RepID=A0A540VMC5_9CHLR|nr:ABC transporter permease [Litorilinea aerophila]MCC9074607.1 ABC transporter permease [Litorilinea aerophila]
MVAYLIRRVFYGLLTIFAVSVLSFLIIQLPPGDYVTSYIASLEAQGDEVSAEEAAALREYFGLGQPAYVQYGKWIWQILHGNFGMSFQYRVPVTEVIGERLLLTVLLALGTVVFIWVVAIPIGIYSAVRQYSIPDYLATFLGFTGLAVPDFLLALVLMYFAWDLYDFSIGGLFSPEYVTAPWGVDRVIDLLKHMIIPVIVLGTSGTASLIRITRANLLDELRKPYVVAARAKGLSEWQLILKYPVRLALNPIISLTAYILPFLVSGSVIVSVVLSLPTVGPVLLRSLLSQDMFLAGAIILLIGVMTVIGTLLSDILLALIDPRVRLQ